LNALRYPLVCFDLDGTLVDDTVFIWKTLHDTFATDPAARKKAHQDFFAGKISYKKWFEHDLKLLVQAGATQDRIHRVLTTLKPMTGAAEILTELKGRGHKLAIVSGSLDIVIDHLFERTWFDHLLINRIHFDEQGRIAGGEHTPYDFDGKADGLRELARREQIPMSATAFVGDNDNDLWIAKAAGLSIAFNCKSEELRQICHLEVRSRDLRDLGSIID